MYILFDGIMKARKKHQCEACGRRIEQGQQYYCQKIADGEIYYFRLCMICYEYVQTPEFHKYERDLNEYCTGEHIKEHFMDERCPDCVSYGADRMCALKQKCPCDSFEEVGDEII